MHLGNDIKLFKYSNTDLDSSTIYVTDNAITYFCEIRDSLDKIASDLILAETGEPALSPSTLELTIQLYDNINTMENFLRTANKNDINSAKKILSTKDILIKFETIKKLMLGPDGEIRNDAVKLFVKTGNLYSSEEMEEFVNLLNETELRFVMQIVNQEKTLIEKRITNTPIHFLANQRINSMNNAQTNMDKKAIGYADGR